MMKLTVAVLCTGCFLLHVSGQDFDLSDALDSVTKKPPMTKKPPGGNRPKPLYPTLRPQPGGHGNRDDYFNLGDAVGGNDDHLKPQPYPRPPPYPGSHGDSGAFNDLDLNDGKPLPPRGPGGNEHISTNGGNTADATKTAQITSPVVSILVLCAIGGLVGYNAYKKKRYCFKPRDGTAA